VLTHPTILLHVVAAVIVVIVPSRLLSGLAADVTFRGSCCALGLAFVLLAFVMGENYVQRCITAA
jgi:hypothetical protein